MTKDLFKELFEAEADYLLSWSDTQIRHFLKDTMDVRIFRRYGYLREFHSGHILMVFLGLRPCNFTTIHNSAWQELCNRVVVQWFTKHKKLLRAQGFDYHEAKRVIVDVDQEYCDFGFIFKDKNSAFIDLIDKGHSRELTTYQEPNQCAKYHEFSICYGYPWDHTPTASHKSMSAIGFFLCNATPFLQRLGENVKTKICCKYFCAGPENAVEVGSDFARHRSVIKTRTGMESSFKIMDPDNWPDDAIIQAWLAAAHNDIDVLIDLLEKTEVIQCGNIPDGRFHRIIDQINEKVS